MPKMVDALYNPQWGRMVRLPADLVSMMQSHGFAPVHTGGGCMAWERPLDEGGYIWITCDNGLDGERNDPAWIVGRYFDTDEDSLWHSVSGVSLGQALDIATKLPQPTDQVCAELPESDFA